MDESIEVLQRCFVGEAFSFHGKRFQFDDVVIRPGYVQTGGPPLWIAAMSKPGAERAARFDAHLLPQGLRADAFDHWVSTLQATGRHPEDYRVGLIRGILVTNDRERDWPSVRAAERYRMELYQRFFEESGEGMGIDGDRIPQTWIIGDVDTCVDALVEFIVEFGMTDLVTWGAPPGLRPAQVNESLEKLFRDVVPSVRERLHANG
jgi:alkanesulfonate monooxygenase SsuD/methylene tetrahydromethanopterin reductase-like flavin-dependent oxidoreductase (luciferase family)